MTVANEKRPTSPLSATQNMPYTPETTTSAARERFQNRLSSEAKKKLKDDIDRRLKKDSAAVWNTRSRARRAPEWDHLDPQRQERTLKDEAMDAIRIRKERGQHVSCVYPLFADYVPPIVEGRKTNKDPLKESLMYKQIDLLESQGYRGVRDEESDDEEPNPFFKKEGGEETPAVERKSFRQHTREIESLRQGLARFKEDTKPVLATTTQRSSARTASPRHSSDTSPSNDEYESDSEHSTDLDSEPSDSDTEDLNIPFVAVLRGQPLTKHLPPPTPSRSKARPKHRLATSKTSAFQAVLRGHLPTPKPSAPSEIEGIWVAKKGMTPRKRFRGAETAPDTKTEDRSSKEHKKTKPKAETGSTKDTAHPLQAVLRGAHLPTPKKPSDPSEKIEWVWVAKKGMVPKKRVREPEDVEHDQSQQPKNKDKKARIEAEA